MLLFPGKWQKNARSSPRAREAMDGSQVGTIFVSQQMSERSSLLPQISHSCHRNGRQKVREECVSLHLLSYIYINLAIIIIFNEKMYLSSCLIYFFFNFCFIPVSSCPGRWWWRGGRKREKGWGDEKREIFPSKEFEAVEIC